MSLVKSKTPKVTYFSAQAKCMLMESGCDFEAVFYEGPKFSVRSDGSVRVIDSGGMNITMLTESDSKLLSTQVHNMWNHVKMVSSTCVESSYPANTTTWCYKTNLQIAVF